MLESENDRPSSPIYSLVDTTRLGIMGFSMGGGGTLKAVNTVASKIKTALSLAPHEALVDPSMYTNISVPIVVTTGTRDSICPRDSVDETTQDRFRTFVTAWLKYYLAGDPSYATYLTGQMHDLQNAAGRFTEYEYYP